ncbi:MAG TPA: tetratricopeptide repeat protein [Rhodocyclaceae bacterium]|nr:tetratricopeptide repeat protein [Rhodocyclaceae bacterium]
MAVYDLEEQEQLDELKTWWKQYGNLVTGIVVAAALAMVAWQGWTWWQRNQAAQAGAAYAQLEQAVAAHDPQRTNEAAGELIDKFSGTAYAGLAALLSAKVQADAGDLKTAKLQLTWAAEHAKGQELRDLARLRLGAVLLDEKAYGDALQQLTAEPAAPFAPRYAEERGDILAAQGKTADAQAAYAAALAKLDAEKGGADQSLQQYRQVLQIKLDALGGKS